MLPLVVFAAGAAAVTVAVRALAASVEQLSAQRHALRALSADAAELHDEAHAAVARGQGLRLRPGTTSG